MAEIVVPITEFKAKCLGLPEQVAREGGTVVVTKRGKPLVKVAPVAAPSTSSRLGSWKGKVEIAGDVVHLDHSGDWEIVA